MSFISWSKPAAAVVGLRGPARRGSEPDVKHLAANSLPMNEELNVRVGLVKLGPLLLSQYRPPPE